MKPSVRKLINRRSFFKEMAASVGAASLMSDVDIEGAVQNVNRNSLPVILNRLRSGTKNGRMIVCGVENETVVSCLRSVVFRTGRNIG